MLGAKLKHLVNEIDRQVREGNRVAAETWNLFVLQADAIADQVERLERAAEPNAAARIGGGTETQAAGVVSLDTERRRRLGTPEGK